MASAVVSLLLLTALSLFAQPELPAAGDADDALPFPQLILAPEVQRPIQFIGYRDDGRLVITTEGGSRRNWDSERGILISASLIPVRTASPFSSRLSSDGRTLWTASPQGFSQVSIHTRRRLRAGPVPIRDMVLTDATPGLAVFRHVHTGQVAVLDPSANPPLQPWDGGKAAPDAAAIHPSGQFLAVGDLSGTFVLWDRQSRNKVREFTEPNSAVTRVVFSPDGKWIAVLLQPANCLSTDQARTRWHWICEGPAAASKLLLLDGTTGAVHSSGVFRPLFGAAFSRDGRIAAWGPSGMFIAEAASKKVLTEIDLPLRPGSLFAFSPDGSVISGGSTALMSIDTVTGRVRSTWNDPPTRRMEDSVLTPQGRWLFTAISGSELRVTEIHPNLSSRKLVSDVPLASTAQLSAAGESVAAFSQDGIVRVWDVASGAIRCRLPGAGVDRNPLPFRLSPDGTRLAIAGNLAQGNPAVDLWDTAACRRIDTFAPSQRPPAVQFWRGANADPDRAARSISRLEFSPDGARLAWSTGDNLLRIWSLAEKRELSVTRIPVPAIFTERNPLPTVSNSLEDASGARIPLASVALEKLDPSALLAFRQTPFGISGISFSPEPDTVAVLDVNSQTRLWRSSVLRQTLGAVPPAASFILNNRHERTFHSGSVLFLPDGRGVVSFSGTISPRLFDLASGNKLLEFSGIKFGFERMYLAPGGKVFVSGSSAFRLLVVHASTGESLGRIAAFGDGSDWLAIADNRHVFDGSSGARRQMSWRFSDDEFDVASGEAFFGDFYRPGLIQQLFDASVPPPVRELASVDRRQARVVLEAPAPADSRRQVPLRIRVSPPPPDSSRSQPGTLRDLRLFRNGSLIRVWRGELPSQGDFTVEPVVTLSEGRNDFTAYCFNSDNVASREGRVSITGAPALKRKGRDTILAIGINQYANPEFNLRYAASDSRAVVARLRTLLQNERPERDLTVVNLTDAQATRARILSELSSLSNAQPEDRVILFFAGHGWAHDQRFYLIPHDLGYSKPRASLRADPAGQAQIRSRALSDSDLSAAVEAIPAGEMVLIIDACNSGQVLESQESRPGPFNVKGLAQLAYDKGMYVLTASQSYQVALEASNLEHGYLTYALIQDAFRAGEADSSPPDNRLTIREWFDYAAARVPQLHRDQAAAARLLAAPSAPALYQTPRVFYRRDALDSFSLPLSAAGGTAPASLGIEGAWLGKIERQPPIFLNLNLYTTGATLAGTISQRNRSPRPDQLQSVEFRNGRLKFEVPIVRGVFEGTLSADGQSIRGTWLQNFRSVPLTFTREPSR